MIPPVVCTHYSAVESSNYRNYEIMRFRVEAWLSSPDFYKDIKKNVRNVSRVIKACLRLYIGCPQFKLQVDEYIQKNKDRII